MNDRQKRLQTIAIEMDKIVQELAPKWIKLAHLNKEAKMIMEELKGETAG